MTDNKKTFTVVVGLGVTGLAAVRYLVKQGVELAVTDSRLAPPALAECQHEFPQLRVSLGEIDSDLLQQATEIVLSPGVSPKEKAILAAAHSGVPIISDIELFARHNDRPVIAITGSNGKTTVTTLVGLMVQQAGKRVSVCGNIGRPVLEALLAPQPDYYVMELSSFQLEATDSLESIAATVLNISPDHLDRYSSCEEYLAAKQRIYRGCQHPVVNQDKPGIWKDLSLASTRSFSVGGGLGADFSIKLFGEEKYLMHGDEKLISTHQLKLQGEHHWENALAALALADAAGLPRDAALAVLRDFPGLPHRCQWIKDHHGVAWYNDSKGTNIGATEAAVNSLGKQVRGRLILIAGGLAKGAEERDFLVLRKLVEESVSKLILIGKDAPLLERAFKGAVPIVHADSMEAAVSAAARVAQPGDAVLLSPACASLDMFNSFEHRGDVFAEAVRALC